VNLDKKGKEKKTQIRIK